MLLAIAPDRSRCCGVRDEYRSRAMSALNIMGLGDPVGFESLEEGHASQRKLANLSLDAAGFGHGKPMARDASTRFRNKYVKHSEDVHEQRSAA